MSSYAQLPRGEEEALEVQTAGSAEPELEADQIPARILHEGPVALQFGKSVDAPFIECMLSLAEDDTLTVRAIESNSREGEVLRTASAALCDVCKPKQRRAPPHDHTLSITLWNEDSLGDKKWTLSVDAAPELHQSLDVSKPSPKSKESARNAVRSDHPHLRAAEWADTHPRHPAAMREWVEALAATRRSMSGDWYWQFAVIFGLPQVAISGDANDEDAVALAKDDFEEFVISWCAEFHRRHFVVAMAERTEQTKDRVAILLRMEDSHVMNYFRSLQINRWEKSGDGITLSQAHLKQGEGACARTVRSEQDLVEGLAMTQQDRVFTIATVLNEYCRLGDIEQLHNRLKPFKVLPQKDPNSARDWVIHQKDWLTMNVDPRIIDIIPLKDEEWIGNMQQLWRRKGGAMQSFRGFRDALYQRRALVAEGIHKGFEEVQQAAHVVRELGSMDFASQKMVADGVREVRSHVQEAITRELSDFSRKWRSPFASCTLHVTGLPPETDEAGLEQLFQPLLEGSQYVFLQGTILPDAAAQMNPGELRHLADSSRSAIVTLDQQEAVDLVLESASNAGSVPSWTVTKLDSKAFSRALPRVYKVARAKATAKALQGKSAKANRLSAWEAPSDAVQRAGEEKQGMKDGVLGRAVSFVVDVVPEIAFAFQHRDDAILEEMKDELGPKVSIYFAFLNCYTTSTGLLAVLGALVMILVHNVEWLTYLRILSVFGLLTASIWAPLTTRLWQRRVNFLLFDWRMRDPTVDHLLQNEGTGGSEAEVHDKGRNMLYDEDLAKNPKLGNFAKIVAPILSIVVCYQLHIGVLYGVIGILLGNLILFYVLKPQEWRIGAKKKQFLMFVAVCVLVLVGFVSVTAGNFILIEYIQYLTTLPLCDTFFHEVFEINNEYTGGGLFSSNSTVLPLGPNCFDDVSSQFPALSPFPGTRRGFLIFLVGIVAALLIGVVYDLFFRKIAEWILNMLNIKMQVDYEVWKVWVYFPFMWSGFMSYFLLAAALVPFGMQIDPMLLSYIHWWTAFKERGISTLHAIKDTVKSTASDLTAGAIGDPSSREEYGGCISNHTLPGAAGGPQPGVECVFPLKYCDVVSGECQFYNECTLRDTLIEGKPWCATRTVDEGGWEGGHWGYCNCINGAQTVLDAARVDDLVSYWRFNHRFSISLDTLMIGPLVVTIWLDFLFKNLIPVAEYHRRRFVALRRGQKLRNCCALCLLNITCCCAKVQHEGNVLQECVGPACIAPPGVADQRRYHDEKFALKIQNKLEEMGGVDARKDNGVKRVVVVRSLLKTKLAPVDGEYCCKRLPRSSTCSLTGWAVCRCCRCCRCQCCDEAADQLSINTHAANYLLVESAMYGYDTFFEFAELAGQFSYITMFTIVFPLGALIAATRNLCEAQWDASRMWRDFRRPVPARPSPTHPLGGWEDMIRIQGTVACVFTSAFFVFCTGMLEAWVVVVAGGTTNSSLSTVETSAGLDVSSCEFSSWRECSPVREDAIVYWTLGSQSNSQSKCSTATLVDTDGLNDTTEFHTQFMAPNYNCWELDNERVPENRPVCEWDEQDFKALKMGMGFHQLSVRMLVWLILNHFQFFISQLVLRFFPRKQPSQEQKERRREWSERKIMSQVLFHQTSCAGIAAIDTIPDAGLRIEAQPHAADTVPESEREREP